MIIDGDVLKIDLSMDLDEVVEFKEFVKDRLEYIESIELEGETKEFTSSALFQILYSIKQSKPSMRIDCITQDLELDNFGKIHWIENE